MPLSLATTMLPMKTYAKVINHIAVLPIALSNPNLLDFAHADIIVAPVI